MNQQILVIAIIVGAFLFIPVYGYTLSVDKSSYEFGDTITLTGSVNMEEGSQSISVQILNPPQSDIVQIDTFIPNSDGSFSRTYQAEGPKWNLDGTYTLRLFYNEQSFQTTFGFSVNPSPSPPPPQQEPPPEPKTQPPPKQKQESEIQPKPKSPDDDEKTTSRIIKQDPKTHIPGFPALNKSPQYYFDRYSNESNYKNWFDSQFPSQTIQEALGYTQTHIKGFPENSQSPQYYITRYNEEEKYKEWFDSQFPDKSIYQVLGFPDPVSVPNWIKNNAQWWSTGKISNEEFISSIQFMIENDIIVIPNLPEPQTSQEEILPYWVRNNANWWAHDKISEEEFVNGIKYLIQNGIIDV